MKKIGLVILALVLVLGTMGVGYSMWFQTITVTGNVGTGRVSVALDKQYSSDPADSDGTIGGLFNPALLDPNQSGDWTQTNGVWSWAPTYFDPPNWGKNVADTVCRQNSPADGSMTITINNGYPGYIGEILVGVTNTGTVPVKILHGFSLSASNTANIIASVIYNNAYFVEPAENLLDPYESSNVFEDVDADAAYTITVSPINTSLVQIEPGQTGWFVVTINVMETVQNNQHTSFTFVLSAIFAQWNEVP